MKYKILISVTIMLGLMYTSCKDFDEMNVNPNAVTPELADLNLLLPGIEVSIGKTVVGLGFGDLAGVVQHTQKDGWSGGHNNYDWNSNGQNWSSFYGIRRNNEEFYNKAVEGNFEFHKGVALVMRAYISGLITDLWGDSPYTEAIRADEDTMYYKPKYDKQEDIYKWILADLDTANTLLSKDASDYKNIIKDQDVIFHGDVSKWRKFANSLALRYYMRLSEKLPDFAKKGIFKIASQPNIYPLILSSSDDANISYIGSSTSDSWPTNTAFDKEPDGAYWRLKMCSTLVDTLQKFNDPRLGVWANKIEIPLVLLEETENSDTIIDYVDNGIRYISYQVMEDYEENYHNKLDFDKDYVGIPPAASGPQFYNLNPDKNQGVYNPHCSQLNDMYKETAGPLLLMRIMSAAEVNFILAEAASYNWINGDASSYYREGIAQSLEAWGTGDSIDSYLSSVPYSGLESIMIQKWIASWSAAAEAWFDYRRTGLPALKAGPAAIRPALPLRFYYNKPGEIDLNKDNAEEAIERLVPTEYIGDDVSNNSAWSKMWVLQGTGKPY